MADRIASDHHTIETVRATVIRRGGTRRLALELPDSIGDLVAADIGRLVIDGTEYHAPISSATGGLAVVGAYYNARKARERTGPNVLDRWLRSHDRSPGRTVAFDVVVPSFRYGLRLPNEDAVYDTSEPPNRGLRDIAERLDGG